MLSVVSKKSSLAYDVCNHIERYIILTAGANGMNHSGLIDSKGVVKIIVIPVVSGKLSIKLLDI